MEAEKIRSMSDTELAAAQRDEMDQLFRLKFQMKMGQTESLKKIQGLRRGVARLKTIARERALGISGPVAASAKGAKPEAKTEQKAEHKTHAAKQAAPKKAAKSKSAKSPAKSKAAGKKSAKKSGKR
jgi:large subunit ribosomal protein L29